MGIQTKIADFPTIKWQNPLFASYKTLLRKIFRKTAFKKPNMHKMCKFYCLFAVFGVIA